MSTKKRNAKSSGYWNRETCREEALKYTNISHFMKYSCGAYQKAQRNGWMDYVASHFARKWTFETCKEEALKYEYRLDFSQKSSSAYTKARKNGWLDVICSHMKNGYKTNRGTGRRKFWFYENCKEEASKYNKRDDFRLNSKGGYMAALKHGWLDEITVHMLEFKKHGYYWTLDRCRAEALKYKTKGEFIKKCGSAYSAAQHKGWLGEICSHMPSPVEWVFESCKTEALKYSKRWDFSRNAMGAYQVARKKGWLDQICAHMVKKWTFESCKEEALKYSKKIDFLKKSKYAYQVACRAGWLGDICSHMISGRYQTPWTFESFKVEALKCSTRVELIKNNPAAYQVARKNGWLDEFFPNEERWKRIKE